MSPQAERDRYTNRPAPPMVSVGVPGRVHLDGRRHRSSGPADLVCRPFVSVRTELFRHRALVAASVLIDANAASGSAPRPLSRLTNIGTRTCSTPFSPK